VALCKGNGSQPFMISSHSQREIVRKLGWESVACIWGGPVLTLVSLAYLFEYFGLK
jgi:hypothetical protein